jgi:hypothetical protein
LRNLHDAAPATLELVHAPHDEPHAFHLPLSIEVPCGCTLTVAPEWDIIALKPIAQ